MNYTRALQLYVGDKKKDYKITRDAEIVNEYYYMAGLRIKREIILKHLADKWFLSEGTIAFIIVNRQDKTKRLTKNYHLQIIQCDKNNNQVGIFSDLKAAAKSVKAKNSKTAYCYISNALNSESRAYGYYWKYESNN